MSLVKPSLRTRFHIDFDWWKQNENDWRVHLSSLLCPEHQALFAEMKDDALIDFVDPETAEVRPMDSLQQTILSHCARQPDFVTSQTQLVEGVFRAFLANGNSPLTPTELSELLGRPANTILVTISGPRVYKGIRPARE